MEKLVVEEENIRLDQYLSNSLDISRSKIQKLLKQDKILVNGKKEKSSYLVQINDLIEINS